MDEIEFISDASPYLPKKKAPEMIVSHSMPPGDLYKAKVDVNPEERFIAPAGYPPEEFFKGPLNPPQYNQQYPPPSQYPQYPIGTSVLASSPQMGPSNMQMMMPSNMSSNMLKAMNCIDVSDHANNCPVCTKIYKPSTNIYVIIILALIILCFILGRKYFE